MENDDAVTTLNELISDLRFARVGVGFENPGCGKWEVGRLAG
jgi:hypothetical protein